MSIPPVAYQGLKLALNSLHVELSYLLEKTNAFSFRYFKLSAESRDLADAQESLVRRIRTTIIHVMVSLKYRLDRLPTDITRIEKQMRDLTNADKHEHLLQVYSAKAIRKWDKSSIGKFINVLDDIYLKWLEMAKMAIDKKIQLDPAGAELPGRIEDFLSIVNAIEADKPSFFERIRQWFHILFGWRPRQYGQQLKTDIEAVQARHAEQPEQCCKAIKTVIHRWRERLENYPENEQVNRLLWLGASYQALFKALRRRYLAASQKRLANGVVIEPPKDYLTYQKKWGGAEVSEPALPAKKTAKRGRILGFGKH